MAACRVEASHLQQALEAAEARSAQAQALLQELQAHAAQRDARMGDLRYEGWCAVLVQRAPCHTGSRWKRCSRSKHRPVRTSRHGSRRDKPGSKHWCGGGAGMQSRTAMQMEEVQQCKGQLAAMHVQVQEAQCTAAMQAPAVLAAVGSWVEAALGAGPVVAEEGDLQEAARDLCRAVLVAVQGRETTSISCSGNQCDAMHGALEAAGRVAACVLTVQHVLAESAGMQEQAGGTGAIHYTQHAYTLDMHTYATASALAVTGKLVGQLRSLVHKQVHGDDNHATALLPRLHEAHALVSELVLWYAR